MEELSLGPVLRKPAALGIANVVCFLFGIFVFDWLVGWLVLSCVRSRVFARLT